MWNYCKEAAETFPGELPWLNVTASAALLSKSIGPLVGKPFSNSSQTPTANLWKTACNLFSLEQWNKQQFGLFHSASAGKHPEQQKTESFHQMEKKKGGGGDVQEDKNNKRLPQEPCFPQWSRAIWKGQFKLNGFHRWGFGAPAHAAFQQLEIRKVKLQISDINWRRIQTKLQAISTAEEWFSPEYNNWITGSPFFIQVCG